MRSNKRDKTILIIDKILEIGKYFVSSKQLYFETSIFESMSERTMRRIFKDLVDKDFIKVEKKGLGCNKGREFSILNVDKVKLNYYKSELIKDEK